jgi:hypothetical protein
MCGLQKPNLKRVHVNKDTLPHILTKKPRFCRTSGTKKFCAYTRIHTNTHTHTFPTQVDHENKTVKLCLRGAEVLENLRNKEELHGRSDNRKEACAWHPEYGSWMVEGTPRMPFGGFVRDLRRVELSMRLRRQRFVHAYVYAFVRIFLR